MTHVVAAFVNGFLLALGLILPLGAQNSFILNQSSREKHYWHTLPIVITAALSDTFLILLAVFGVSIVLMQIFWLRIGLLIFGVLFMVYVGWVSWRAVFTLQVDQDHNLSIKRKIIFALSVSILNPYAILDTVGVIGTSSILYVGFVKIAFITACIVVSWLWFFSLAALGRVLRRFEKLYQYQGKISAVIIWLNAFILLTKAKALW
jgi:L-lysine exporter family protein LysE/ArgO